MKQLLIGSGTAECYSDLDPDYAGWRQARSCPAMSMLQFVAIDGTSYAGHQGGWMYVSMSSVAVKDTQKEHEEPAWDEMANRLDGFGSGPVRAGTVFGC